MEEIPEDMVPKEVTSYTRNYLDKLSSGDISYCFDQLDKQAQDNNSKKLFNYFYENLKDNQLKNSAIIYYRSSKTFGDNPISTYEIGYEYNESWVYYSFKLLEKEERLNVLSLNVSPFKNSLRHIHQFTLTDKGFLHYLFLLMNVAIPLFILVSIGFSIKTPLRKKWLWIVFMLLGFVSFNLNWTDGDFEIKLMSIKLLGTGFSKTGIIAPWVFSFAIPVGAIMFWIKRAQLLKELKNYQLTDTNKKENNAP